MKVHQSEPAAAEGLGNSTSPRSKDQSQIPQLMPQTVAPHAQGQVPCQAAQFSQGHSYMYGKGYSNQSRGDIPRASCPAGPRHAVFDARVPPPGPRQAIFNPRVPPPGYPDQRFHPRQRGPESNIRGPSLSQVRPSNIRGPSPSQVRPPHTRGPSSSQVRAPHPATNIQGPSSNPDRVVVIGPPRTPVAAAAPTGKSSSFQQSSPDQTSQRPRNNPAEPVSQDYPQGGRLINPPIPAHKPTTTSRPVLRRSHADERGDGVNQNEQRLKESVARSKPSPTGYDSASGDQHGAVTVASRQGPSSGQSGGCKVPECMEVLCRSHILQTMFPGSKSTLPENLPEEFELMPTYIENSEYLWGIPRCHDYVSKCRGPKYWNSIVYHNS